LPTPVPASAAQISSLLKALQEHPDLALSLFEQRVDPAQRPPRGETGGQFLLIENDHLVRQHRFGHDVDVDEVVVHDVEADSLIAEP
jgi:hypothetical protein